jgi:hypothetical protein
MFIKPKLRLVPLPKSFMRAAIVTEFLTNLASKDVDAAFIQKLQTAVAAARIRSITVDGLDRSNRICTRYILKFDPLTDDTMLHVDLGKGKSHIEALDAGMAAVISHALSTLKRRSLKPTVAVEWTHDTPSPPPPKPPAAPPSAVNAVAAEERNSLLTNQYRQYHHQPAPAYQPAYAASYSSSPAVYQPAPAPVSTPPAPRPQSEQPAARQGLATLLNITAGKDNGVHLTVQEARTRKWW